MKPGDLVRIHPARSRDQYGDLEVYNLFNPGIIGSFTANGVIGTFTANEVGMFISGHGAHTKVMVNGVIGLIYTHFIEVVE